MYAMMSVFLSLTVPGNMTVSDAVLFGDQASCERQLVLTQAYLQGRYADSKEWKYANTWCTEARASKRAD